MDKQGRDIAEMRKQLTLWTRNTSAREAYTCWAHQQANSNLSEIPITQIPDLMQTNAEKGRPMFYGCLKLDYGASTSSQADPQEPVPLRTAPPIPGATWRLSCGQPTQPIQLRRAELTPLARGWQEFIIHSIIPTGNKSEDVRAEELIADNIAVIAQGMQGKGKLAFPSTIYKMCKDAQVPMHEFRRTDLIPQDKPITARLMETTRLGRNVQAQQQQNEEEEENQPMPQFEGGNEEDHDQGQHQHFEQQFQQLEAGMQLQQQQFFENMQSTQAQYLEELKTVKARQDELWNNTNKFHHQIRKEQDMIAREIQEVKKFQVNQTLMGFRKEVVEKLEQTMGGQQREITEIKKQLKEWTTHAS
ncbi:hypothetical protein PIB30_067497 [Stylosanthes scabra]|uniref:Uncharacterized protein n=1 Tax=Stylosanthes scabra TaxID=79078 RepID=A0ABU6RN54_9FABA|nr:hypothetical protein [Stylosanthes scabra]